LAILSKEGGVSVPSSKRLAHNARIREWVAANPEKRAAINRRYYDANRDYVLWAQKHKGAK
jgi:hypothetical protein